MWRIAGVVYVSVVFFRMSNSSSRIAVLQQQTHPYPLAFVYIRTFLIHIYIYIYGIWSTLVFRSAFHFISLCDYILLREKRRPTKDVSIVKSVIKAEKSMNKKNTPSYSSKLFKFFNNQKRNKNNN